MKRLTESKLFLDSSYAPDIEEVNAWLHKAGYAALDGQTTNPSYFTKKNPEIAERFEKGERMSRDELIRTYRQTVEDIYQLNPADISVEVYADKNIKAEQMIEQARQFSTWIPTARIKLPIIEEGFKAAKVLCQEIRLNMTLGFSQAQAAAVYAATLGSKYPVVYSAFIGRLDDNGFNGVDNVANVHRMLASGDGHVWVLSASYRTTEHIMATIQLGVEIMTINYDRFKLWRDEQWRVPDSSYEYHSETKDIPYQELDLSKPWSGFDIQHDLTDQGLQQFADDWNSLIAEKDLRPQENQ